MAADNALSRTPLAEQVKDRLLQEILSGRYPADARIRETSVARELGISQAPVREALRGLEAIGVVEIEPFRGARVRRPSTDELAQGYAVRTALEVFGARIGVPTMTAQDLAEIEQLHDLLLEAAASGDRHEMALRDAAFHARLLGLAHNPVLDRVWGSLEPLSRTSFALASPRMDPIWTAGLHLPIVRALRNRDTEGTVAALEDHFAKAAARLVGDGLA